MRKLLFGGMENGKALDVVMMLLRGFAGVAMLILHGWGKLFDEQGNFTWADKLIAGSRNLPVMNRAPEFFGWSGTLAETLFALLLAVGLMTRISAAMLAGTMVVAAFVVHRADPFARRELALLYLFVFLVLMTYGSGRYGIDSGLRRRNIPPKQ